jgi:Ni,Fe-hydrogenase III component G
METVELIEKVKTLYERTAKSIETPENQSNRVDVFIEPDNLLEAVSALKKNERWYLIAISAYDTIGDAGEPLIGMVYHFAEEQVICSLRFFLPHNHRVVQSICPIIPSATIYERECMEMYGIDIQNTPDRSKLLLPDDWPDGIYPMFKSFTGLPDSNVVGKAADNE